MGELSSVSGADWDHQPQSTDTDQLHPRSVADSDTFLTQSRPPELTREKIAHVSRPGISPLLERTRYARTSDSNVWLHAPRAGFVGAILDSVGDGRDRVLLAWPSPPDSGFVAAAIALREARATGLLAHATLAYWPWRTGATHAARSILVHPKDLARVAAKAVTEIRNHARWADPRLAHTSLCMVELRLNDLAPRKIKDVDLHRNDSIDGGKSSAPEAAKPTRSAVVVRNPTLLETTTVFAPSQSAAVPAYTQDAEQILKRMRQHTRIDDKGSTIGGNVAAVGDPGLAPFALMGLEALSKGRIAHCLEHRRFTAHGLDVVVVDLTRYARASLAPDWERQLSELLSALDAAGLPRRPPVVVLCEDAFAMRRADVALRKYNEVAKMRRLFPLQGGALLLSNGILEAPDSSAYDRELPPLNFEADIKDASLVPLRSRLVGLARRLREAGHDSETIAVRSGLRFLCACASLPVSCAEAKRVASILFDGDGPDEVRTRSTFYATSVLGPMAAAERTAPAFATDIHELHNEIGSRIKAWNDATPVSMKLAQLLGDSEWNARDVLLVLPDSRTADIFRVSDRGVSCACTVIDAFQLFERTTTDVWRRIMVVRPEPRAVRALLAMRSSPEQVLLLGDSAGASLIAAELGPLSSLRDFRMFAVRAAALSAALVRGGASEVADLTELEYHYHVPTDEEVIDLTQAADGYVGEVVRLILEGGGEITYRPGSDVLVFTPDEIRRFCKVAARNVQLGDSILVLHQDIRDRLSQALSRSRKTTGQLRLYHEKVARFREGLQGDTVTVKARRVLAELRKIDPSIGDCEVPNIARWLSVEPSDSPQPPCAPRDQRRFSMFAAVAGIDKTFADALWNFAILPSRVYRAQEGHLFNRRIVQFVIDPEGVTAGAGRSEYDGLWHAVANSVGVVIHKETSYD